MALLTRQAKKKAKKLAKEAMVATRVETKRKNIGDKKARHPTGHESAIQQYFKSTHGDMLECHLQWR